MQGWAKGLKDRVERTATQLSSQASTAFTPPDENDAGTSSTEEHPSTPGAAGGADATHAHQGEHGWDRLGVVAINRQSIRSSLA